MIEGKFDGACFVLRKATPVAGALVEVRCGTDPSQSYLVDPSELLTLAEALAVMLDFRQAAKLPTGYATEPKAYLWR